MVWYGMVWYGVGMVFGMACYGLLCCVEACEQVRTMPASRNPLEGNLHPAAPAVCSSLLWPMYRTAVHAALQSV